MVASAAPGNSPDLHTPVLAALAHHPPDGRFRITVEDDTTAHVVDSWLAGLAYLLQRFGLAQPLLLVADASITDYIDPYAVRANFPLVDVAVPQTHREQRLLGRLRNSYLRQGDVIYCSDASVRRHQYKTFHGGWAWVSFNLDNTFTVSTGPGPQPPRGVDVVELSGVLRSCRAAVVQPRGVSALILCDSKSALRMLPDYLREPDNAYLRNAVSAGSRRQIQQALTTGRIELGWVHGHAGDLLNELADAAARCARRSYDEGETDHASIRERATDIVGSRLTDEAGGLTSAISAYRTARLGSPEQNPDVLVLGSL